MPELVAGACVRCGMLRADYGSVCPGCGDRPEGEGRRVAWLLSGHHLDGAELEEVSARIRAGEVIRPSRKKLRKARRALGQSWRTDSGLTIREKLGVLTVGFAMTPLPGFVLGFWWRDMRPRAAAQAVMLSLPGSLFFAVLVLRETFFVVGL
jgi:hypothetical protein